VKCIRCGREFSLTTGDERQREQRTRRGLPWTTPKRCGSCRWERRQPVESVCAECNEKFLDTIGRVEDLAAVKSRPLCERHRPSGGLTWSVRQAFERRQA
jgi:hypothetical protein